MENTDNSDVIQLYKNKLFGAAADGDTEKLKEVFLLPSSKISINTRDSKGWTALMLAARNGHLEATEMLLKHG